MRIGQLIAGATFALATMVAGTANAAVIFSEDFNDPGFKGAVPILVNDTSDRWAAASYYSINDFNGWSFSGGAYYTVNDSNPADGALLLNENGTNANSGAGGLAVRTLISGLIVGGRYDVSLLLSGDNRPGQAYTLNVAMGSSALSTAGVDLPAGTNPGIVEHYIFTATATSEVLALSQASGSQASPILDNLTISAVPEPAMWAMMLTGFFGLGAALRMKRRDRQLAMA